MKPKNIHKLIIGLVVGSAIAGLGGLGYHQSKKNPKKFKSFVSSLSQFFVNGFNELIKSLPKKK